MEADVVIVGGGPAGMMAGLLFARAGVPTLVIEKHGDFLRDFRGDTVHPSTLALFDELGLADALLARPHDEVREIGARVAGQDFAFADMGHLPVRHRFVALMPQWEFLDFVAEQAKRYPAFALRMECEGTGLVMRKGRVTGVVTKGGDTLAAKRLVIAADGRSSILRGQAALPREDLGAPIDVFWFRVPKTNTPGNDSHGIFAPGLVIALIDRGDYWQCGFVFRKGQAETIKAQGIAAFRDRVVAGAPELKEGIAAIASFDDVKLLSVSLDRLRRWHRLGLLAIGDAAHAMSPVGGVGVNLAVQDAVAAANILAGPLREGRVVDGLLQAVQDRRMFPTRVIQGLQRAAHRRVLGPVLAKEKQPAHAPLILRAMDRIELLRRVPARIVGLGVRREHIRSPEA